MEISDDPNASWITSKWNELLNSKFNENPSYISYIVIHHSLTNDGDTVNWDSIRAFHKSWRFGGESISEQKARELQIRGLPVEAPWRDIGYHFGIERVKDDFQIMRGRELNVRGAHVGDGHFNIKSIGICLIGNFDKAEPPERQFVFGQMLVNRLIAHFGSKGIKVPVANVIGHWEAQKMAGLPEISRKTCPGRLFDMDKFRSGLQEFQRGAV